jgi:ectoine hydroxylase-related dioxygenase (phytanoyl-CoA dioxygenase family)
MPDPAAPPLTCKQIADYHEHGFLHIPDVFEPDLLKAMRDNMDWMIRDWANVGVGWTGPWRQALMDIETETRSQLIAMHDLQYYADSWMRAVTHRRLVEAVSQLLAGLQASDDVAAETPVELHHSTMHVKPPETGQPFPMHQDLAFYDHADDRYVDVLVHLDDTCHANGEIRFVDGSHKLGRLDHIKSFVNDSGDLEACTPHLPWADYPLDETVAVPAKAGDVVVFNILTIHGSHVNRTDQMRRLVRVGYKHPDNRQTHGQSASRPNLMVKGRRQRREGQVLYSTECHGVADIRDESPAESAV